MSSFFLEIRLTFDVDYSG